MVVDWFSATAYSGGNDENSPVRRLFSQGRIRPNDPICEQKDRKLRSESPCVTSPTRVRSEPNMKHPKPKDRGSFSNSCLDRVFPSMRDKGCCDASRSRSPSRGQQQPQPSFGDRISVTETACLIKSETACFSKSPKGKRQLRGDQAALDAAAKLQSVYVPGSSSQAKSPPRKTEILTKFATRKTGEESCKSPLKSTNDNARALSSTKGGDVQNKVQNRAKEDDGRNRVNGEQKSSPGKNGGGQMSKKATLSGKDDGDPSDLASPTKTPGPPPSCRSRGSSTAAPESGEETSPAGSDGSSSSEVENKKERSRSVSLSNRLDKLAKPKAIPETQPRVLFEMPPKKTMPTRSIRPSILVRVRPINVEETMTKFFDDPTVAPIFAYQSSPETVRKAFTSKSTVDFSLFDCAKGILEHVMKEHGGADAFMARTFGGDKIPCHELVHRVKEYLEDLNLTDKVEIRTWPQMLSAANVVKPSPDGKYIVNLTEQPVSEPMVESICDHEIGTHLLRMLNDEHQVWHGCRERHGLQDPWITEEGFATINTYRSMRGLKIMYPQALKYYATCRGAELGFCELYTELEPYMPDPTRRFRLCCRVKRGLVDTSAPGAFNVDQAYFKGAVDILRKLDVIDFGRLYSGQVAIEDMDKIHFLIRKEVLRLPKFLNSYGGFKKYLKHCKQMIEDNMLEMDPSMTKKSVFIRAAKQLFFNKSEKPTVGPKTFMLPEAVNRMSSTLPTLNLDRINDLSKPKNFTAPEPEPEHPAGVRRSVDPEWLAAISKPPQRTLSEPKTVVPETEKISKVKAVALQVLMERRLEFLSLPKQSTELEEEPTTTTTKVHRLHTPPRLDKKHTESSTTKKTDKVSTATSTATFFTPATRNVARRDLSATMGARDRSRSPTAGTHFNNGFAEKKSSRLPSRSVERNSCTSSRAGSKVAPPREELRMSVCVPMLQI